LDVLTDKQIKEIENIIDQHMSLLTYVATGKGKIDPSLLKSLGLPAEAPSLVKNSFILGKIIQLMKDSDIKNMSFQELKEKAKIYKLSPVERNSLKFAEQNAAQFVTALGNRVTTQILSAVAQAGGQATLAEAEHGIIKDTVAESILKQHTRSKLATELGHADGDWLRDWQRVATTELWNAKLNGEVMTILQGKSIYANTEKGDTKVFRRPAPDACAHCKRLLLESDGVTPKVFKLSELIANGTNVGKKTRDWLPIVGTIHPNCVCPIAVLPAGFGFDSNGDLEFQG
jgi:hypothetical protein